MLELRELRLILAIDEHGSLLRASRMLGMAQSAVTRGLAAVEAKLRGPLFERSARGAITTDLGRAVIEDARDILARMQRLDRHLAEARGSQVQDLSVVAGSYLAESLALTAAAGMMELYPKVRVRLVSSNWAEVARAVLEREASIGMLDLRGFQPDPALEAEPLRRQPGIFAVRPGHPLALLPQPSLAAIMAYPLAWIGRTPREVHAPMVAAREAARDSGSLHPAFPALVHESPTVALNLLHHSDAVVGVTVTLAARMLRQGDAVALVWREPWLSLHPAILRLRGRRMSEAEQGFLDLVHNADHEAGREAQAICTELGLSGECG